MSAQRAMPPSQTLAPWAEIVPGVGPTTVDALLAMPDDGWHYEVVEGVLVRVAGSGKQATTIGGNIYVALRSFVQPRRLGVPTPADGVYKFAGAETGLLPAAGFYDAARDALITDPTKPIPFAPDLAAEVASPDQTALDIVYTPGYPNLNQVTVSAQHAGHPVLFVPFGGGVVPYVSVK